MGDNCRVFIVNGSGGVGKDTFVDLISVSNVGKVHYSSVTRIKEVARQLGWDGKSKTEKDRKFLSDLKDLVTDYSDLPYNLMCKMIDRLLNTQDPIILFIDIREPNEIQRIVDYCGARTILVKRDSVEHITSNTGDGGVFNYNYDIVVDNNGTLDDLKETAKMFSEDLEEELRQRGYLV